MMSFKASAFDIGCSGASSVRNGAARRAGILSVLLLHEFFVRLDIEHLIFRPDEGVGRAR